MDSSQALKIVQELLKPKRLNAAQEIVVIGSWDGKRYQEIADDSGYDFDYLKEVGAQLWLLLSQTLGRSVTKKNLRLVLEELPAAKAPGLSQNSNALNNPLPSYLQPLSADVEGFPPIHFPSEALPIGSPLYMDRPPIEFLACQEILKPGGFVRVKAPRQMGKTSLILRILQTAHSQGIRQAILDFQKVEQRILQDLNQFLKWVCVNISRQLGLQPQLEDYWDEDSGSKMSCHIYFQEHLLKSSPAPFVLVLDELNRIFEHPELAQDFLPLLRSWHDEAARNPAWHGFRLVVVHSTELYVPLNLNQSPFNVGLPIELPPFTQEQLLMLAQRHRLDELLEGQIEQIFDLIAGHPYLTQILFYQLRQSGLTLQELLQDAITPTGIYSDYLRRHLLILETDSTLKTAFRQVLDSETPVQIRTIEAYRLESMGLIRWANAHTVAISCRLYRKYFMSYLSL